MCIAITLVWSNRLTRNTWLAFSYPLTISPASSFTSTGLMMSSLIRSPHHWLTRLPVSTYSLLTAMSITSKYLQRHPTADIPLRYP